METIMEIDERLQRLREELTRLVREGEDEEGIRLRGLLAEMERLDFKFWPVFNLADSAIVVGMLLLLAFMGAEERAQPHPPVSSPSDDPQQGSG